MVEGASVLRGEGATLCEKAKWRVGEHQGEVGELTVVILVEEEHLVALSTVRVEDAEEGARRCGDGEGASLLGEGQNGFVDERRS